MFDKMILKIFFLFYDLAWACAIPILRRNQRLADGLEERLGRNPMLPADLWIQAVSGGEAFLARRILEKLRPSFPIKVLVTTYTRQGLDILTQAAAGINRRQQMLQVRCVFFPFDRPKIINRAVRAIKPRLAVLLESEIWPGFLHALKENQAKIVIINGRINPSSAGRYMLSRPIWRSIQPDRILAVSNNDAQRFARIFDTADVQVVPNIKFDGVVVDRESPPAVHPIAPLLGAAARMIVLASVRQEEEPMVLNIIVALRDRIDTVVPGLVPRHLHRVAFWRECLSARNIPWVLRSKATGPIKPGTVIIWDRFGELNAAYGLSCGTFVGGSLAPVGGQNFLEPLAHGIRPVIGPHWHNFTWVGRAVIDSGLVEQVADWQAVVDALVRNVTRSESKEAVRAQALNYIKSRKGGTLLACRSIEGFL